MFGIDKRKDLEVKRSIAICFTDLPGNLMIQLTTCRDLKILLKSVSEKKKKKSTVQLK
jgi:hypothetical protein